MLRETAFGLFVCWYANALARSLWLRLACHLEYWDCAAYSPARNACPGCRSPDRQGRRQLSRSSCKHDDCSHPDQEGCGRWSAHVFANTPRPPIIELSQSSNGCFWRKAAVQGIQAFAAYAGDDKKLALTESGTATRMPGCLTRQPLSSSFQKIVFEPSSGEISAMRLKSPHDAARY
jgi:hypothetical protein